jgi:hypothetical protein
METAQDRRDNIIAGLDEQARQQALILEQRAKAARHHRRIALNRARRWQRKAGHLTEVAPE